MPIDQTWGFASQAEGNNGDWTWDGSRTGVHSLATENTAAYWCWTNTGSTSSNTGPPSGTACVYPETSSPTTNGDTFTASLASGAAVDASQYNIQVTFNTCMQGNASGSMAFQAWDGSQWNTIDSWNGNTTTSFTARGPYDFSPTGLNYTNSDFRVRFLVTVAGTAYQNDFSFDEVRIYGTDKQVLGAGMILASADFVQVSSGAENPGNFDFEESLPWGAITIALRPDTGNVATNLAPTSKFDTFTSDVAVVIQNDAEVDGLSFEGDVELADNIDLDLVTIDGTLDISVAGTYTFEDCFINEVVNSSGGSVIINAVNTTIITNSGPNITINNSVPISVTVQTATGSLIEGARVYIEAGSGGPLSQGTEIINETTSASGVINDTFNFQSNQPVVGRVRKGSSSPFYKTSPIVGTITAEGFSTTVIMISD